MTTYAAFDERTEMFLRESYDDTYRRPLFSLIDDDRDCENGHCSICEHGHGFNRWVPDNGGAWVSSQTWEEAKQDYAEYIKITEHWNQLRW